PLNGAEKRLQKPAKRSATPWSKLTCASGSLHALFRRFFPHYDSLIYNNVKTPMRSQLYKFFNPVNLTK
ncbi:MAG: hypothetical protein BECKG1743D_GA0114223_112272, partial [Candidatus Kentron sp. G]